MKHRGFLDLPITNKGNFPPTALAAVNPVRCSLLCLPPTQFSFFRCRDLFGWAQQNKPNSSPLQILLRSYLDKIVGNVACSQGVTISSVYALLSPETVLNGALNRFFQQSSQPSDALKFSTFIFSANLMALVLKTRAKTATSLLRTTRSYLNIVSSKFAKVPHLNHWRFELLPFFVASKTLSLIFSQVDQVFFGIPYFAATCDFVFPSSPSFKALYLSLMGLAFNLHLLAIVAMMMNRQESCK